MISRLLILSTAFILNCTMTIQVSAQVLFENEFQSVIDSIYLAHPEAVGIMVHIEAPRQGVSWSGCVGYSEKNTTSELTPDQPALIASTIKPYVSAAILRLQEMGELSLDLPIEDLVSAKSKALFESDGYDFSEIKIKHLLSHTSGIFNYANMNYLEKVNQDKSHRWTRDEQLELTISSGDPLGAAADTFEYTDANFLLATEIIENITEKPFYEAMRDLLRYDELNLEHTWFPTLEEANPSTKALVHQYWSSKDWDSYEVDISFDLYGGGGLAATTKDVAKFFHHLFKGKIIRNTNYLYDIFDKVVPQGKEDNGYRMGLVEVNANTYCSYGHGGFWGTTAEYCPELDAAISVFVLDRDQGKIRRDIINHLVNKLARTESAYDTITFTPDFELYKAKDQVATLVIFPGGAHTAMDSRREFKILETARRNNISVLLMNFNRHLWIEEDKIKSLATQLENTIKAYDLSQDKLFIGGMSIGGNITLSLSNYLHNENSDVKPQGIFVVDSPIDLNGLYESSVYDTNNPELTEERLQEPKGIIEYLQYNFGNDEDFIENIQKVSPFTLKTKHINVAALKDCKMRFYTEPDKLWWKENRQTEYQYTNAYTIQEVGKMLSLNGWQNFDLFETKNKGYRSNGEKNPHSWSIVDIDDLIQWIKE